MGFFKAVLEGLHGSLCIRLIKRRLFTDNGIHFPIGMNYAEDKYVLLWCLCYSQKNVYINQAFYHYRTNMPSSISAAHYPNNLLGMAISFRNHCLKEYPSPYNHIAALFRELGFYRKALLYDDKTFLKHFPSNFGLLKKCFWKSDLWFSQILILAIAFYISPYLAHLLMKLRISFTYSHKENC